MIVYTLQISNFHDKLSSSYFTRSFYQYHITSRRVNLSIRKKDWHVKLHLSLGPFSNVLFPVLMQSVDIS